MSNCLVESSTNNSCDYELKISAAKVAVVVYDEVIATYLQLAMVACDCLCHIVNIMSFVCRLLFVIAVVV